MEQNVYNHAFVATTGTAFTTAQVPFGIANALLITGTQSAAVTITLADGTTTCALGSTLTVGTLVPIRCTKVAFTTGSIVGLA